LGGHFLAIDDLDPALAAAIARAFNRWVYDRSRTDPARLKFAALVPLHDVDAAIAEARFAVAELGAVALSLPSNPVKGRTLYHPDYDRLWAEIEDLNATVGFHGLQAAYQDHLAYRYIDNLVLSRSVAQPVELMLAVGAVLAGGVFERFPGLRAGFLEGTCGWLLWWLWRLDEEWEKFGAGERVQLRMPPSEYFRRHCAVATDPEESLVRQVIEAVGDDNIVLSSDWPHDDALYPHAIETFLAMVGLSEESKRKVLWDNCARLYRQPA
jgi:predicted TIM-barrel fold metal-dependent hydrolase